MSGNAVFIGHWINWSKGYIQGATLTLAARNGTLLIAFLALFVTWAGNQLWTIATFAIHQHRSSTDARDAFHHQQQVLLRSGLSDVAFLWRLFKISWSWKSTDKRVIQRTLPLFAFSAIHLITFFAASLFISRIATSDGEVLLKPDMCGWPNTNPLDIVHPNFGGDSGPQDAFYIGGNDLYKLSKTYLTSCYSIGAKDNSMCNTFIKPLLSYKQNLSDSCPFDNVMCTTPTASFDSGYIDSHQDLGINTQKSDRIQFRKKLACSVIPTDRRFSTDWTSNATEPFWPWEPPVINGIGYKYYYYGPQNILSRNEPYSFYTTNYTLPQAYYSFFLSAFMNNSLFSVFEPIPELSRIDADISLIGIENRVQYVDAVQDPLFKATTKLPGTVLFSADNPVSIVGCTEQYQFCNGRRCTGMAGRDQLTPDLVASIGFNGRQMAIYNLIMEIIFSMRMFSIGFVLQDDIFLAKEKVFGSYLISSGLPENQWQLELGNLFNLSLAVAQLSVLLHASPQNFELAPNKTLFDYLSLENTTEALSICQNQKIRTEGYYSFSVLGLSLVLVAGTMSIVMGQFTPNIIRAFRRRWPTDQGQYRTQEWKSGDILQLQRVALESCGVTDWIDVNNVPVSSSKSKSLKLPWLTEFSEKSFYIDQEMQESTYKVVQVTSDIKAWRLLGI